MRAGLALQHFTARGDPAFFVLHETPFPARQNYSTSTIHH